MFIVLIIVYPVALGLLGSVIPGLPGPPVSFVAILILHFFIDIVFTNSFLWLWGVLVVLISLLITFLAWGVKKFGGGNRATTGTFVGLF